MDGQPSGGTAPDKSALNVFISYSRRDSEIADAIADALSKRGFNITIDRRNLPFGEKWQAELADFIRSSDSVIWLISEPSIKSDWVNWELDEVARRNKRLIPVVVGEVERDKLPRQLGEIHLLPATGNFNSAAHLETLVQVLETDRSWIKEGSRLADRAQEWLARDRGPGLLLRGAALASAERWKDRRPPKAPPPAQEVMDLILASRRGATQRQRWWVAGSLVVAIGALGLAAIAYTQRVQSTRNEMRALQNSAEAKIELARAFMSGGNPPAAVDPALNAIETLQSISAPTTPAEAVLYELFWTKELPLQLLTLDAKTLGFDVSAGGTRRPCNERRWRSILPHIRPRRRAGELQAERALPQVVWYENSSQRTRQSPPSRNSLKRQASMPRT